MRLRTKFVTLGLCLILLATAAGCHRNGSWENRSHYVGSASINRAVLLGCHNGDKQGRMTLFFGAPSTVGRTYGATLWGAPSLTTRQIVTLGQAFVRGYVWCRRSPSYQLLVGFGTSNSVINDNSDAWLRRHGYYWSGMVWRLARWAGRYYPNAVAIYGAWDAEPSWSSPHKAHQWIHGYEKFRGWRPLYANNSADGCPSTSARNGRCNNGWIQEHLWHLSWQHDAALPIPQIYANSGVNARQWQQIDEFATHYRRDGIWFYGVMSQLGACRQVGGCRGTTNSSHHAHNQLLGALNSHGHTRQSGLQATTDVRWHS